MSDLDFDLREMRDAFFRYEEATGKALPDIVNKASLTTLIGAKGVKGAVQRTPRADPSKIDAVPEIVLRRIVLKRARAKGQTSLTEQEIRRRTVKERKRRHASRGYTAGPGWHKAIVTFGGHGVRGKDKPQSGFTRSLAAHGSGVKAKRRAVAEFTNTAPAAPKIGHAALQASLNAAARDMREYADKKLARIADRYSAR